MRTHRAKLLSFFLSYLFLINGLVIPAQAQRRAIVVNAEQPNVWTLEQAHYLLAQMHRRNLDLRAEGVGTLDANEINGLNFEVLRTLVEFGAIYDDADRFNNSLLRPQKRADAERALRLQQRRDELAEDSFRLSREIARLERERTLATTPDQKDNLAAQIAELTSLREANEKSIERLDKDIAAAAPSGNVQSTAPPEFTGANRLPKSEFDESFKEVTKSLINRFNQAPKLNAALRLDNFLQLQYEIIAKQLTLLRDEVGPGERIIFLEMPQSVNATYDKANNKWAQSWWKVAGYTTPRDKEKVENTKIRSLQRQAANQADFRGAEDAEGASTVETYSPFFTAQDFQNRSRFVGILKNRQSPLTASIVDRFSKTTQQLLDQHQIEQRPSTALIDALVKEFNALVIDPALFNTSRLKGMALTSETAALAAQSPQAEDLLTLNRKLLEEAFPGEIRSILVSRETVTTRKVMKDAIDAFGVNGEGSSNRVNYIPLGDGTQSRDDDDDNNQDISIEDRSVRTIDLIPRQGSLNVNDIKLRVRSGVLTAIARTLFGFGASLNVQRQRETFSQFVQQELYSSSFGKGSREFGWTFSPMPGTDRVLSGTKTTYAVMVVPNEAEALIMYSNGCFFPRSEYQPTSFQHTLDDRWNNSNSSRNCSGPKAFAVPIPGGGDENNYDFWVDALRYVPADKADRVTLMIYGRNFPAQVGLLVDGIPLTQSIGVAQPLIRDDSQAFREARAELRDGNVLGHFERIDANQIVAVFARPGGKDGVQPLLTVTAPGKAIILNTLRMRINGNDAVLNANTTPLLFGKRPADRDAFRIDKVEIYKDTNPQFLVAAVTGAGFKDSAGNSTLVKVLVNGQEILRPGFKDDSSTLLRITIPIPSDDTIKVSLLSALTTIESSPVANPAKLRVNNVTVISYDPETDNAPGTIVVKLEGSGFSDDVMAYLNEVAAANALRIAVKSSTEAILKIDNPDAAVIVVLEDTRTGQRTKTVITRKKP